MGCTAGIHGDSMSVGLRGCFENHAVLLASRLTISRIIANFSRVSLVWSLRS